MNNISKIVLGTVQFGCQYGINSKGQPSQDEVGRLLRYAAEYGVVKLDTSSAYGNAETILGNCMPQDVCFQIISKYPKSDKTVREGLMESLKRLKVKKLYGYLLHHFELYRNNKFIWEDFRALKREGWVEKIGFSLYSVDELELLISDGVDFDILQIPRNILDNQFDTYLPILNERDVEVHVRSTFLQGLFFKDRTHIPPKLLPLKSNLLELDEYANAHQISIAELAMNYNLQNNYIDGVLIGVDTIEQLKTNLSMVSNRVVNVNINIEVIDKDLLNPVNWT